MKQGQEKMIKCIGHRVRETRQKRHKSIEELAADSNLSVQTLKQIESGRRDCYVTTLKNVADALGVTTNYLIDDTRDSTAENILAVIQSMPHEKRKFAESLVYQVKALPYEFMMPVRK